MKNGLNKDLLIGGGILFGILIGLFIIAAGYRVFGVWSMEMKGKASLAEASQSRKIQIEQARGELEAAKLRAEAIAIVGEAAKKYPEYRTQELYGAFGEALREGTIDQIIYVPTENQIPILRAGIPSK